MPDEETDTPLDDAPEVFPAGEEVKIARKAHVIDRERENEGLKEDKKVPLEMDVTGFKGYVCGMPYASKTKDGETCVPIDLGDGSVLAVPTKRLERVNRTPRREENAEQRGGSSPVGKETMEFWRKHFETEEENRRLREELEALKKNGSA